MKRYSMKCDKNNEYNCGSLKGNGLQWNNALCNLMVGNKSYWTERNWMDHNIHFLLWIMKVYNESNWNGLERNILQLDNNLWNMIGLDKSDLDGKELIVLQFEVFNMEHDGIWWIKLGRFGIEWILTWNTLWDMIRGNEPD